MLWRIYYSMGYISTRRFFLFIGILFNGLYYTFGYTGTNNSINTECPRGCLKCNPLSECTKCRNFILLDSRICVDACPSGYQQKWSIVPDVMGQICQRVNYFQSIIAITVGSIIGLILCIIIIILIIYLIKKRKKKKSFRDALMDETIERSEFLRQLDNLRLNADNFLAMLNDTRKQIRKLHTAGDISGALSYHPVVRDLAKLLILLNKPNEVIPGPPHDWHRLAAWADYLLEHHKPQMAQLIDFYQTPNISSHDPRLSYCQHSTFKSNITRTTAATTSDSSNDQQNSNLFGSLISLHEFDQTDNHRAAHHRLSGTNPFGSSNNIKYFYQSPELNGSSLWLEDEFFKLGFRPQDEITTEL